MQQQPQPPVVPPPTALDVTEMRHLLPPEPEPEPLHTVPTYENDEYVTISVGSLDAWLRDVARVQAQVRSITRDLDALEAVQHACVVGPDPADSTRAGGGIDDSAGSEDEWARAARLGAAAQARIEAVRARVNNLSNVRTHFSATDARLANAHQHMLLHQVMGVAGRLRGMQAAQQERAREAFLRMLKITKPDASHQDVEWALQSTAVPRMFSDSMLLERDRHRAVQERHRELATLDASISELNVLFSDLALLINEQDAAVDSIAAFAEGAGTELEQAGAQVEQANASARSARRNKWILFVLCLLAIGGIVALVLAVTLPGGHHVPS
ncbi:t-SNARE [Blastocladiella britannica]|nr:t-SNARE [Blastocladiella britannica]